jgi:hypothetical protein
MCPFADRRAHEHVYSSTFAPLRSVMPQPLGAPYALPHSWVILWRVRVPKVPTFPTSVTLGCQSNLKFLLLEDLGEGSHDLLFEDLTSSPTSIHCHPRQHANIHKIFDLQVSFRTCAPIQTKSVGNPRFHANWKPHFFVKVETPSFQLTL